MTLMSVERGENKPRSYQRFLPGEFRKEAERPKKRGREIIILARERLAGLQKSLKKTELPKPFLGLDETAKFLREISPDNYPSVATVEKIVKIAVILGDFPLPPKAVRVSSGEKWKYRLTKRSLLTTFDVTLQILETRDLSLGKASRQAKKTFQEEREKRIPVENLFPEIKARKIIIENLQQRKLPLRFDVKSQEILIFGVLKEDQDYFIDLWAEFVQEKMAAERKVLAPWTRLALGRKEKSVHPLSSGFQEIFNLKTRSIYTKYAAFYLQKVLAPYGVEIVTIRHPNGVLYDSFVEKEDWEKLMNLRQQNKLGPIFAKVQVILKNGFQSVEDYRQYCPPDFLVALSEVLRLLDAPLRKVRSATNVEKIKKLFDDDLQEVNFHTDKKTGKAKKAYYLPLKTLEELMKPSNLEARPKLTEALREMLPLRTLYHRGELLSLTALLKEAGLRKVPTKRVSRVYEFLKDKLKVYRFEKSYQLLKRERKVNLEIIKDNWEEIKKLICTP